MDLEVLDLEQRYVEEIKIIEKHIRDLWDKWSVQYNITIPLYIESIDKSYQRLLPEYSETAREFLSILFFCGPGIYIYEIVKPQCIIFTNHITEMLFTGSDLEFVKSYMSMLSKHELGHAVHMRTMGEEELKQLIVSKSKGAAKLGSINENTFENFLIYHNLPLEYEANTAVGISPREIAKLEEQRASQWKEGVERMNRS